MRVVSYFVASSNARAMDARGYRPGRLLQLLVLLPGALLLAFWGGLALLVGGMLVGHFLLP